jgi:hypothetical protein
MAIPLPLEFGDSACGQEDPIDSRCAGRPERKRAREEPPRLELAAVCLDPAERTAVPANIRGRSAAVGGGVQPRRNWARRVSRVETPSSLTCHVRHSWLIRRLLSESYTAHRMSSLDSGASVSPPARKNFAECLKTEGCVHALGEHHDTPVERDARDRRVECTEEENLNAPVDEWLESATMDISGGGGSSSSGRLMWPTSMEDSSSWTAWSAEEGCLADTGSNLVVPRTVNSSQAELISICVGAQMEELLLPCPVQFLVSLPEDDP